MQYLLYTPAGEPSPAASLSGLVHADDSGLTALPNLSAPGPDGQPGGSLWHFDDTDRLSLLPVLEYRPQEQFWSKLGARRIWIGTSTKSPVTPEALLRGSTPRFGTWTVRMADGQEWFIPCQADLPVNYCLNDAGEFDTRPKPEYLPTWERMCWAFDRVRDLLQSDYSDELPVTAKDLLEYAGDMLSLNYRLTPEIAVALSLFDPICLLQLVKVSSDVERVNQMLLDLKKKDFRPIPAASASLSGSKA